MSDRNIEYSRFSIQQHWFQDGVSEIAGGCMFILTGLFFIFRALVRNSLSDGNILAGQAIFLAISFVFIRWTMNTLKEKFTYNRSGYMEQKHENVKLDARRRMWIIVISLIVGAISLFISEKTGFYRWISILVGTGIGLLLFVSTGLQSGMHRFYLLAFVSILLGIILAFIELHHNYIFAIYFITMGITFGSSGLITLRLFLKQNLIVRETMTHER
ncbi:MAG TPA: hypothetical protein PLL38_11330 [Anaerolineales bacterium]|nr:hypothetical protein [Anaerolineales bacterium]